MSYGGGSGSSNLHTDGDVALSNPADGQVLEYNASLQKWENQTPANAVDATTVSNGIVRLTGDLGGTAASPTVAKLNGVAVTGTPSANQVLVATGSAAASWSTPVSSDASIFYVDTYHQGGDTDDTASFTRAAAAMVAAGKGILMMSGKTYNVTALPSFTPPNGLNYLPYAFRGPGSETCRIIQTGTSAGATLTVSHLAFNPGSPTNYAPTWGGFTIDGTGSSGGCSGLSWSDVSYGSFSDIEIRNFTTGDGMYFPCSNGWTEGININAVRITNCLNGVRFAVGTGASIGTITSSLASGTAYTSLTVAGGITTNLSSGQQFVIYPGSGTVAQTVTTSGTVSSGATSIPVISFTAGANYTSGIATANKGSYGSFDYWTVESLYLAQNANQNGIVSEVPLGFSQQIDRLGSSWRITGNFNKGASNTGCLFWLKGNDHWGEVGFDVACEIDGGAAAAHTAVKMDTTGSYMTGHGRFLAYYFGTPSFAGGLYQFGISGRIALASVTDSNGSTPQMSLKPFGRNIASGITPGSYPTSAPTSGTSWQNTTGTDVLLTVPITFTGAGTAKWNVDVWSGLPAGSTAAAVPATGYTIPLTFVHYQYSWARIDVTGGTIGTPTVRYV